jgi:hypothetical protein
LQPKVPTGGKLSGICVALIISAAMMLTVFPNLTVVPAGNGAGLGGFPLGPFSPTPTFSTTTTEPQIVTLSEAESHYCPSCVGPYPNLYGIQNDYFEAKVQPNGAGTTWYIHFPTTNGSIVNGLETSQSYNSGTQVLTVDLINSNTKLRMADRLALVYTFNLGSGYEEVDVMNLTALKAGSGGTMSLEYSSAVQTGDVFQFVPYPNGAMLDNGGVPTAIGNCQNKNGPDCLYSSGYMIFGEASLTRTCVVSSTSTTSYSGTKTITVTAPSGDCAAGAKCAVHSTTSTGVSSTTTSKYEVCTIGYSTSCASTNTSTTFSTSAKLPNCDESDWTASTVLHTWGDTNNYQKLDALENSWEITARTSAGTPILAIKLDDVTDKFGNRAQTGTLEWLDTYSQELLGLNQGKSQYTVLPSEPPSQGDCKSFALTIPTSRGTLSGTIKVTPYIGTGCPVTTSPNPYVGSLSGTLTLTGSGSPVSYTVTGVATEFMCNRSILTNCELPLSTSVTLSCSQTSLAVGQQTACTGSVSDSGGDIQPTGTVSILSSDSSVISSGSCTLPAVTTTSATATCTVTLTGLASGSASLTATYSQGIEDVQSPSGPSTAVDISVT